MRKSVSNQIIHLPPRDGMDRAAPAIQAMPLSDAALLPLPWSKLRVLPVDDATGPSAQRREVGVYKRAEVVRVQHRRSQAEQKARKIEHRPWAETAAFP